jgi:hypothetical protein
MMASTSETRSQAALSLDSHDSGLVATPAVWKMLSIVEGYQELSSRAVAAAGGVNRSSQSSPNATRPFIRSVEVGLYAGVRSPKRIFHGYQPVQKVYLSV